jgi:hypothetical protein
MQQEKTAILPRLTATHKRHLVERKIAAPPDCRFSARNVPVSADRRSGLNRRHIYEKQRKTGRADITFMQ